LLLREEPDRRLLEDFLLDFPGLLLEVVLLVDLPLFDFAMSPPELYLR
jgi:hypothetical protein